jgi:PAS domain S-box-containing protein
LRRRPATPRAAPTAGGHRRARPRSERLTSLSALTHLITSATSSEHAFRGVAEAATGLLEARMAWVFVDDPARGVLRTGGSFGLPPEHAELVAGFEPAYGAGVAGAVFVSRRAEFIRDVQRDPRWRQRRLLEAADLHGCAACPLINQERAVGVLIVLFGRRAGFTREERELAGLLASQAAIAIENARLYEEAERQRREAEVYRRLVEGSIQGIHVHRDWVTLFANTAWARMMGYESPREVIGLDARRWIAPHDLARLESEAAARTRGEPAPSRYECQALTRDGTPMWTEIQLSSILWDGAPATQTAVLDITERKRAEEALRQSEEQLRQAQKMEAVGRLAGGIAHDFNNLLTVITGRGELLLRRLPPDDPSRRDLELIKKTADRASLLIMQLLAFSRKQVLQPKVLDLNGIVAGIAQLLQRLIGEDVDLVALLDPNLGAVRADPAQLEQIVLNLAVNARDAMPRGGRLSLETSNVDLDAGFAAAHPGATAGPHVLLQVSDTGVGMSAEVQAHIFEPFFTTKEVGKGTGLGLATVYGIVKQHEGYIAVESGAGHGATFRIYLRRIEDAAAPVAPGAGAPRGSETILLVEDEDPVRELARDILTAAGYKVLAAAGPAEALDASRRHGGPIHLLLTDVVIPEMSGRELVRHLAPTYPEMRVLYMTGHATDTIVHRGVLDPGLGLLQKPFTPDALTRKVREVLTAP